MRVIDLPPLISGVFVYRSIADLEAIIEYAQRPGVTRASVIGGGVSQSTGHLPASAADA